MPHSTAGPFRAATYNIHSCLGTDRRFAPERIAEVIAMLGADVVGLQEVGWHLRGQKHFDQFAYFREATGYHVCAGLTRDHARAQFGNALLTRNPVKHSRVHDLTIPYRARRTALEAIVEVGGRDLRVISAHFGLDPFERAQQFARLQRELRDSPRLPMILMGDFNEWRLRIPPLEALREDFPHCLAPRSFHTRRPLLRLDRIYASADFKIVDHQVIRSPLTRRASDHLPVCGDIVPVLQAAE